jgi:hypothetical protein
LPRQAIEDYAEQAATATSYRTDQLMRVDTGRLSKALKRQTIKSNAVCIQKFKGLSYSNEAEICTIETVKTANDFTGVRVFSNF